MPWPFWFLFVLLFQPAHAVPPFSLAIGALDSPTLHLRDVSIQLTGHTQDHPQQLALSAATLAWASPPQNARNISIRCQLSAQAGQSVQCLQGQAQFSLANFKPVSAQFSVQFKPKKWAVALNAARIPAHYLSLLPQPLVAEALAGTLSLDLALSGSAADHSNARLTLAAKQLSAHTQDGRYAAEKLNVITEWQGRFQHHAWRWRNRTAVHGGAFYADPFFWEKGRTGLVLTSQGTWLPQNNKLLIQHVTVSDGPAAHAYGSGILRYQKAKWHLERLKLALRSRNLKQFSSRYLNPLLAQGAWAGIALDGQMTGHLTLTGTHVSAVTLNLTDFAIQDEKTRFGLQGGSSIINWSNTAPAKQTSYLQWQRVNLGPVSIGAAQLNVASQANRAYLLNAVDLPVLGGQFTLSQLAWHNQTGKEPSIQMAGKLSNASLQKLSQSFGWPPLSGHISGTIPTVHYQDGWLKFAGGLSVYVFDGAVTVSDLAVSGLFSGAPQLQGEIILDNLDLALLTEKLQFGAITGRLSGFVRQLRLENWRPVQFFAWLGTPENDRSKRRISQKAVKNIASISGASPSDIATRGLLNFFDQFNYDKIGLGCYLNDGVCQLMGIGPYAGGYRIIKGGGLPRIDVIGYNTRIDWPVLLERLRRVTATDDAIIE